MSYDNHLQLHSATSVDDQTKMRRTVNLGFSRDLEVEKPKWIPGTADSRRPPLGRSRAQDRASMSHLCRLDQPTARTGMALMTRHAVLGVLLNATRSPARYGCDVLKPLWVHEATQRASNMVRLVAELETKLPFNERHQLERAAEYKVAMEFAGSLHSLNVDDDKELQPCSVALRTAVRNLVELFGPVVGQVLIRTSIERIAMPAYKRKALVLAACELVINALRHGLAQRGSGCISVTLHRTGGVQARLSVVDDGWGNQNTRSCGVTFDLAALLGSKLIYGVSENAGTTAQISFPATH